MMKSLSYLLISLMVTTIFVSCNNENEVVTTISKKNFEVSDFNPLTNYYEGEDTLRAIQVDWTNMLQGIQIPNSKQLNGGYFKFQFYVKNKGKEASRFHYKIFYQNESYKFLECEDTSTDYLSFQSENFYGSWDKPDVGFKLTPIIPSDNELHLVVDSFKIIGNPRFEEKYFSDGVNHPERRNPRVGTYEFMLVVSEIEKFKQAIPNEIAYCNIPVGNYYLNPFDFFRRKNNSNVESTIVFNAKTKLKVTANLSFENGIYADPAKYNENADQQYICNTCNSNDHQYQNALYEQFKPSILSNTTLNNIPILASINDNEYTLEDYYWNRNFTPLEERIYTIPSRPRSPCETVRYDKKGNCLVIKNPAAKSYDWRKEITGVKTRPGFAYGKYTVKCKLTRLLNDSNMWNGITNAIWLITQSASKWNHIRPCHAGGYLGEYEGGENDKRDDTISYSEIDFEIIKAHPYCPSNTFPPFFLKEKGNKENSRSWNVGLPEEMQNEHQDIYVSCTNWDMACAKPSRFKGGCVESKYNQQPFNSFRWGTTSKATTGGQLRSDAKLFGSDYYYFQIEWNPKEIIWRLGPEKNQLQPICYMDSSLTCIPNNQMLLIIDQEFHNTKWWYGAPYSQEDIPFPSKDIIGKIYEVTIE